MVEKSPANKMPREIAPGVFWIGDCLAQRHKGKIYHGYNAAFLIAGETASCLVETGHPKDFPVIERHMKELFARGLPPLKYLFVTHQETPHCGGLGRVLKTSFVPFSHGIVLLALGSVPLLVLEAVKVGRRVARPAPKHIDPGT